MDRRRMTECFLQLQPLLERVALHYLHQRQDAEDAVQSAYLRAFLHCHGLRQDAHVQSYLVRIVINECMNVLRKKKDAPVNLSEQLGSDPWDGVDRRMDGHACMARLRPRDAQLVRLRYLHGYSDRELARYFGCAESTIRSRMYRIRRRMGM